MRKLILISLFTIASVNASAGFDWSLNSSLGLMTVNLAENESALEQTDTSVQAGDEEEVANATLGVVSFDLVLEVPQTEKYSYLFKAIVPLVTSDGTGVFLGGVGFNYYFNGMSGRYSMNINGNEISIAPKFRYYAGGLLGVGNVVYNTESAKKSDVFFDLGVHGGMAYSLSKKWGLRGEVGAARGTGVATSNINIKTFFGMSYNL